MGKYIYQKFLLNCDYETVQTSKFLKYKGNLDMVLDFREDYCLFDVGRPIIRKIDIAYLDENVDTESDWNAVVESLAIVNELIVCGCDKAYPNPIVQCYREATIKAYLYRLMQLNINILLS